MNVVRAETIAAAFRGMKGIRVEVHGHGIRIDYMGRQANFVREASFWSFLLQRISGKDARKVSEIEARLIA
jgi:hypothetical protein